MTFEGLSEAQLAQVLQHLVSRYDTEEPAITEEEVADRVARDRDFLVEAAEEAGVEASGEREARLADLLDLILEAVPETREAVGDAVAQVRRSQTLPLSDVATDILVIAASAALLRPQLTLRRVKKGQNRELDLKVSVGGGGKGVNALLEWVMRFLGPGQGGSP
ncbi:hypothetical protein ACFPOI_23605 [Nonomuraea angiospora]|uniref:Uncharacterized protein n=1 Tax=Nonomuraea angiospora TaxID=46172 RepID=A0ABR9ML97_9ACTN|nr:hypothetical protein [Nonomuraea angiospora]MBE1593662.1 hypothetical protein [Nonomuraea angiospora]